MVIIVVVVPWSRYSAALTPVRGVRPDGGGAGGRTIVGHRGGYCADYDCRETRFSGAAGLSSG